MNSLGGYFAVPLLLLVYTVEKIASKGRIDVIGQFQKGIYSPGFAAHLPLMIVCVGLGFAVLGGMSALFAASYSKDGKRLWLEKSLPVDPFDIFKAKLTMGMIVVSALNLITIALASRFIPIPSWSWIYVFALSETAIAYNASLALLIDCRRPKLVWQDPVQAVKQNINVFLSILVTATTLVANAGLLYIVGHAGMSSTAMYVVMLTVNALILVGVLFAAKRLSHGLDEVLV
jgi:ABC-2 type transport system permease protein